ncbi:hypothetical protein KTG08_17960, partial [[Clostridium] innocuum]|uniref:hypothetical protein n=1 Tax=Clostridium innocuum TaxID=1522 RepID=UPI001C224FBF
MKPFNTNTGAEYLIPNAKLQSICNLFYQKIYDKIEKNKPKERVACFFVTRKPPVIQVVLKSLSYKKSNKKKKTSDI